MAAVRRAMVVGLLVLAACGPPAPPRSGTIIERLYTPALSGSGYGTGVCTGTGSNGGIVTGVCSGVVFYNTSEVWTLVIRGDDGDVWSDAVTAEEWADATVGEVWP